VELVVGTLVNLVILSSMYILASLGFALLFNMLRVLNFAHGAIYMLGAYVCYFLISIAGLNQWIALLLATLIMAACGVFLEKYGFRPVVGDFNRTLMVSIAIIVFLETTVNILAGEKQVALPPFARGVIDVGPVAISIERVVTAAIGIALLAVMMWFVNRTRLGRQMQAVAQHRGGAALQGINIARMSALAFALGFALATIAGCLMGAYLRLSPFMGDTILVKILIIVMLAGAGSINGILFTGLVIGALNAVLPVLIGGATSDAVLIVVVIALLVTKPKGFFGYEIEL
jgi:branched-chain amino acid transport system permease protein